MESILTQPNEIFIGNGGYDLIIYRPHKGSLDVSMAEARVFETDADMKQYIVSSWNDLWGHVLDFEDIVIGDNVGDDDRIGWSDVKYVCTKRMGREDYMKEYGCPQCIGMCATEFTLLSMKE